ncbi:hypothetical protein IPV09_03955 [Tessaracoccus sp. SD287]|uniref:hypothetical protein n=1 Tax=Tessaracoccus sp. SD287 TaxID=2782008 RepID=UPI001A95A612|nr:hypothetical protein [Tessaracoccus sp. SD287]MBO1030485.1 hypothetical protein [Tessaracoccus sp. SD287]
MRVGRWLAGIVLPVLVLLGAVATPAAALPIAPPKVTPVTGIPDPCAARFTWPADATPTHTRNLLQKNFGIRLVGDWWTDPQYRPMVKIVWQTLDAVSCTDFVTLTRAKVNNTLTIAAAPTRSWAWGDWGLTRPGALTFDFAKWQQALDEGDPGRLVRLVIHEMGHAYSVDRGQDPAYWASFHRLYASEGRFSDYGHNDMETYADVLGYYVARCAKNNPYDKPGNEKYYEWARTQIFQGVEFGASPGTPASCSVG